MMTIPGLRTSRQYLSNPITIIFACCLVLCTAIFLASFHMRAYNSDDVVWQNALLYWRPFHHQLYYADAGATYLAKLPVYWLISLVMSPGRGALMVAGLFFTLVNFTAIYFSTIYLLRRAGLRATWLTLLPFVWLASFGYGITSLFVAPNLHNVEVSSIFVTFAILVKIYSDRVSFTRSFGAAAWAVVFAFFMGLMIANDHYYLFVCTIPAFAFVTSASLLKLPMKRQNVQVFILLVASLLAVKIIDVIATKSGIVLVPGTGSAAVQQLIGFDGLLSSIIAALHGLLIIFGADFWGRPISQALVYVGLINTMLLIVIVGYGIRLSKTLTTRLRANKVVPLRTSIPSLLWAVMLCVFLMFVVTTTAQQAADPYHYLIVVPFFAVPLLCWLCATRNVNRYLYVILGIAVVLNTGTALLGVLKPELINEPYGKPYGITVANDQPYNMRLIAYLKANDLTKGFGGYADSNINSYLSKGEVDIIPTGCAINVPQVARFLFAESQLARPAAKTFYLYNPSAFPFPDDCTPSQAEAVIGKPTEILYSQGDTILVYPYDLTSRLSTQ